MFALKVQCDLPEDAIDAAPMPHSIRVLDLNERVITHEAFLYAGHQQPQALLSLASMKRARESDIRGGNIPRVVQSRVTTAGADANRGVWTRTDSVF